LFSPFLDGGRGLGLLLLRSALGVAAIFYGVSLLALPHASLFMVVTGLAASLTGAFLVAGFLTPIASGIAAIGAVASALTWLPLSPENSFANEWTLALIVAVAAAIVPLGPGALSLDARLFGRREIIIPRSPRSQND
jgi:uncharacterized membrane protein YphA (DoxX/SURF4 family)